MLRQQTVELLDHERLHLVLAEVKDELIATLGSRAFREVVHPVGVFAVEVAVGVDHLRLDPQSEVHPQVVDVLDQRADSVGELPPAGEPVNEPRGVVVAVAEPAVDQDEQLQPRSAAIAASSRWFASVTSNSVSYHELKSIGRTLSGSSSGRTSVRW